MPDTATTEAPPAETTPTATPTPEPKGLSVPMGDIIGNMMPNLSEEQKVVLNKGSAKEAPVPPPSAATEKPADTPPASTTEPVKEPVRGTLAEFLPPEAQSEKPPPKPDESAIQELSEADKMLPEDVKGKKGQERWHKITSAADTAIAEVTRLRTENETLRSAPKANEDAEAQIKNLLDRNQELHDALEHYGVTFTPAFQSQFIKPKTAAIESAKSLLSEVNIDPKALIQALSVDGKERREAFDDISDKIESPSAKAEFLELRIRIQDLEKQEAVALADRQNWLKQQEQQARIQRHQAAKEQLNQVNTLYDGAIDYLRDQGFEYLKKNGNPKFDEIVDQIVKEGRTILTETDNPQQLAMAAVGLPLALRFRSAWITTSRQLQAANAEIADLKGSTPGLNGGSSTSTSAPAAAAVTPVHGAVEIAMEKIRGGSI